jgi:hypothetical protein
MGIPVDFCKSSQFLHKFLVHSIYKLRMNLRDVRQKGDQQMKKRMKFLVIITVVVIAFVAAGAVFAQTTGPGTRWGSREPSDTQHPGNGDMLREPLRMGEDGLLHDYFIETYAEKLGLDVVELEERLENGETMAEIALSTGLTIEDFKILMAEVRQLVLDKAVADGVITQEQADWLASRGRRMTGGMSAGQGLGTRGRRKGMNGTGNCIND